MAKKKYYAVRNGRYGTNIYENWNDCSRAVNSWSNAEFRGFFTLEEAHRWLSHSTSFAINFPSESNLTVSYHYESISEEILNRLYSTEKLAESKPTLQSTVPLPSFQEPEPTEPFTEDFIPIPSESAPNQGQASHDRPSVVLSDEQIAIYNEVMQKKKNVFFTGSAGTGKSVLLRQIIEDLKKKRNRTIAVTASTGIAAVNIGGVTLHSWAGIKLGVGTYERLESEVRGRNAAVKRWRKTATLIIDEISMIDGVLFDKLERLGRSLRDSDKPFGGIQLVLSGDFCQLPPVPGRDGRAPSFAFESRGWPQCFNESDGFGSIHRLVKVFRQSDQTFVNMLNALRKGRPDANITHRFVELARPLVYDDGLGPCELFPLRAQVCEANDSRLRDLPGEPCIFVAKDKAGNDAYGRHVSQQSATNLLNKFTLAPDTITLKIGAQVMLIKNLPKVGLVNGSMGQIIDFKSLRDAQEESLLIAGMDMDDDAVFKQLIEEYGINATWPFVRFLSGALVLLPPFHFEVLNVLGSVEASRAQVPLILAWALSIHKSQGQTLERVKVDLGRIFENGQAYVALSRATCLEGLEVQNFLASRVTAHPRVLTFYEELEEKTKSSEPEFFEYENLPSDQTVSADLDEFDEFDNLPDDEATRLYLSAISDGFID